MASGTAKLSPTASGTYQRCWNSDHRIALQVLGIGEVRLAARVVAQDPADVREPEAALCAVRVAVDVVDEAMVHAVLRRPDQHALLQRHRSEEQVHQPHRPVRLVGAMRPQPVIAGGDRHAGRRENQHEGDPGGQAVAVRDAVPGYDRQCDERRQREDYGRHPVDGRVLDALGHSIVHRWLTATGWGCKKRR